FKYLPERCGDIAIVVSARDLFVGSAAQRDDVIFGNPAFASIVLREVCRILVALVIDDDCCRRFGDGPSGGLSLWWAGWRTLLRHLLSERCLLDRWAESKRSRGGERNEG